MTKTPKWIETSTNDQDAEEALDHVPNFLQALEKCTPFPSFFFLHNRSVFPSACSPHIPFPAHRAPASPPRQDSYVALPLGVVPYAQRQAAPLSCLNDDANDTRFVSASGGIALDGAADAARDSELGT